MGFRFIQGICSGSLPAPRFQLQLALGSRSSRVLCVWHFLCQLGPRGGRSVPRCQCQGSGAAMQLLGFTGEAKTAPLFAYRHNCVLEFGKVSRVYMSLFSLYSIDLFWVLTISCVFFFLFFHFFFLYSWEMEGRERCIATSRIPCRFQH